MTDVSKFFFVGTRTFNFFNADTGDGESLYLLAIKEIETTYSREFGVCFVDTCVGMIHVSECSSGGSESNVALYPPVGPVSG